MSAEELISADIFFVEKNPTTCHHLQAKYFVMHSPLEWNMAAFLVKFITFVSYILSYEY